MAAMAFAHAWFDSTVAFALVFPALLLAEALVPPAGGRRRLRGRKADLAWLGAVLLVAPAVGVVTERAARALAPYGPVASWAAHSPIAAGALAFVVADLVAYGVHRSEHRVPWLWRYHSVHHASTPVDALAGYRFHPVNIALERGLPVLFVAAVGFPMGALVPYLSVAFLVTLLAHMNAAVPRTVLDRIVVTPPFHRAHHEEARTHYAFVLPVFDRIFGSSDQRKITKPMASDVAFATNAIPSSSGNARR
jgi:sterol desaturase/sphingolipid hydroxylase (fatty acid hydroxylase superfamily)